MIDNAIDQFEGEYRFLSNFYPCKINAFGLSFDNAEAAFQSQKCVSRAPEFEHLSASSAKRLGRSVALRKDWETKKDLIMAQCVFAKFAQHELLLKLLLNTNNAPLIEGNNWGDCYWGLCNGVGENKLGQILVATREYFRTLIDPEIKIKR